MAATAPSATVYVRNLEERVKIPELTTSLREIFAEFGTIIDLVVKKNLKAKGQAFVVFDDVESASSAVETLQEFELFDKPMQVAFAKTTSDATIAAQGTPEELEQHKRKRLAERERKQAAEATEKAQKEALKRSAPEEEQKPGVKQQKVGAGLKSTARTTAVADEYLPPNKILFVQNLPEDYDVEALSVIFGRFEGFKEVRLVPGRSGLAFVEYDAEAGAISAKERTAGMALGDEQKQVRVTFQRQ